MRRSVLASIIFALFATFALAAYNQPATLSLIGGLGSGVASALGLTANGSGGVGTVSGSITTGNCVSWAPGLQDTNAPCASPPISQTVGWSVRQVTNRTTIPDFLMGSTTQAGWRDWQVAYVPISSLSVCMVNWYSQGASAEVSSGGTATFRIAVEYPPYSGSFYQLKWSGATSGTAAAGATLCSDLTSLGITIPANTPFRLSGDIQMGTGGNVPYTALIPGCDLSRGDEFQSGSGGYGHWLDDTVLTTQPNGALNCIHPALVLANSNRQVWGLVGDSIVAGYFDQSDDPSGARGILGPSVARLGPAINLGVPSEQAGIFSVTANSAKRIALLVTGGATSAIDQLGINDFYAASRTADQVLGYRATIRSLIQAAIPGIRVYDTTVTPMTTSTDQGATTANQTPITNDIARKEFNDFLRQTTSWSTTCTATSGNATLTNCVNSLYIMSVAPGMTVTGTNVSGTVASINYALGTNSVTLTAGTGVTTSGAVSLTFSWPAFSTTWPTTTAGVIDIARPVEGSPTLVNQPIPGGGVWLPGFSGPSQFTHPTPAGMRAVTEYLSSFVSVNK